MGQRISYFKNNFNKGLKELIFENFSSFRQWYLDTEKSSIEEFNEPFGNEKLKIYFNQNKDYKTDFDNLDKNFIDELTSEFIGNYWDLIDQHNDILEFFGPTMSVWRYDESNKMVLATKDKDFVRLWSFIIQGRSLKDNYDFNSYTNDYKIGFLDRQECLILKSKIEFHFGDTETMRQKFWTDREKTQEDEAIKNSKNGSYSLSGHNPKSSGLEYVMEALNELTDKNNELIVGIE